MALRMLFSKRGGGQLDECKFHPGAWSKACLEYTCSCVRMTVSGKCNSQELVEFFHV